MDSKQSTATASQAEYARLRQVSRQAINDLVVRGVLQLHDGKLDIAEADAACLKHLDPAKSHVLSAIPVAPAPATAAPAETTDGAADTGQPEAPISYHAARTMREKYEALAAKAEYLKTIGELVDAEAVRKASFGTCHPAMNAIMGLRFRIDPLLAGETDPQKRAEIWDRELRAICDQIVRAGDEALADLMGHNGKWTH